MANERDDKPLPIHRGVIHTEPCVAVMKLRHIDDDGEAWDNWCITHHHWLNGAPATPIVEKLCG